MRFDANLFAYVVLTVLGLWALADNLAPYHDLTAAGCQVGYVYDGDTVELICGVLRETARLQGFDTPETKSPRCAAEAALGKQATLRLRALVARGPVTMDRIGRDKYGRVLIRLFVGGRDVADMLISEGLAVAYGGGARSNWCAALGR